MVFYTNCLISAIVRLAARWLPAFFNRGTGTMASVETATNRFSDKLLGLLDRIEYRRVETGEDMEDVARIRYKAYKAGAVMHLDEQAVLIDEVDFDSHAYVFGIYYEERLISTVRLHHVTPEHRVTSSGKVFPDEINAFLDAGMSLIDPVRLAADPEIWSEMPAIPYLTLRIATMATDYFQTDRCVQMVKPAHSAFYKRVFDADFVASPKSNQGKFIIDLMLLATNVKETLPSLYKRFPFFKSEPYERRMMFARGDDLPFSPLTVRPTARRAHFGGERIQLSANALAG